MATTVDILPFYKIIEPYLVMFVGTLFSVFITWISMRLNKLLGIKIDANLQDSLNRTALNAASKVFAEVEGPIGTIAIDVGSPMVSMATKYIEEHAVPELQKLGYSPEKVRELALAKLGEMQILAGHDTDLPVPKATIAMGVTPDQTWVKKAFA